MWIVTCCRHGGRASSEVMDWRFIIIIIIVSSSRRRASRPDQPVCVHSSTNSDDAANVITAMIGQGSWVNEDNDNQAVLEQFGSAVGCSGGGRRCGDAATRWCWWVDVRLYVSVHLRRPTTTGSRCRYQLLQLYRRRLCQADRSAVSAPTPPPPPAAAAAGRRRRWWGRGRCWREAALTVELRRQQASARVPMDEGQEICRRSRWSMSTDVDVRSSTQAVSYLRSRHTDSRSAVVLSKTTPCPKKTCDYIFYYNFNNKCPITIIFGIDTSNNMLLAAKLVIFCVLWFPKVR